MGFSMVEPKPPKAGNGLGISAPCVFYREDENAVVVLMPWSKMAASIAAKITND